MRATPWKRRRRRIVSQTGLELIFSLMWVSTTTVAAAVSARRFQYSHRRNRSALIGSFELPFHRSSRIDRLPLQRRLVTANRCAIHTKWQKQPTITTTTTTVQRWFGNDFDSSSSSSPVSTVETACTSTSSSSSSSVPTHDAIIIPDMTGWTIPHVMATSMSLLTNHHMDEPEASITNLLAHALQLPWESGFRDLQHILDSPLLSASTTPMTTSASSSPSSLSSLRQYTLSQEQATRFQSFLQRRLQHEPIQYIVGQWDFMDSTFLVRAPLLCPRPETEELVYHILNDLLLIHNSDNNNNNNELRILDVGCGTGVIGISLAKELHQRGIPVSVDAIDIDPVAVETSRLNAKRILLLLVEDSSCQPATTVEASVKYHAHLVSAQDFPPSLPLHHSATAGYHLVVSNPPYIPPRDMNQLSPTVRLWENQQALCGGSSEDGMDIIRTIVSRLPDWCCKCKKDDDDNDAGSSGDVEMQNDWTRNRQVSKTNQPSETIAVCWMEVDPSQPLLIQDLLKPRKDALAMTTAEPPPALVSSSLHHSNCRVVWEKVVHDFCGRPRFVKVRVERRAPAPS